MSKLGKNLFSRATGDFYSKPAPFMPVFSMKEKWDTIPPRYKEYTVSVTLYTTFKVTDEISKDSDIYSYAVQKSKQKILEEVFGEFRQPLYQLRQAALDEGAIQTAKNIDKILDQMFKENE